MTLGQIKLNSNKSFEKKMIPSSLFIDPWMNGNKLEDILKGTDETKEEIAFKEQLLECTQIYFDGLIENKTNETNNEYYNQQINALNSLLTATRIAVAGFYRHNQQIDFDQVRKIVFPHKQTLIENSLDQIGKCRHLASTDFTIRDCAIEVSGRLKDRPIDAIIPIASGGFEPAVLISDYLENYNILPVRYSRIIRGDKKVLIPKQSPLDYIQKNFSGKRLLFVEDVISSGTTVQKISEFIKEINPSEAYFSAVIGGNTNLREYNFLPFGNSRFLYEYRKINLLDKSL